MATRTYDNWYQDGPDDVPRYIAAALGYPVHQRQARVYVTGASKSAAAAFLAKLGIETISPVRVRQTGSINNSGRGPYRVPDDLHAIVRGNLLPMDRQGALVIGSNDVVVAPVERGTCVILGRIVVDSATGHREFEQLVMPPLFRD